VMEAVTAFDEVVVGDRAMAYVAVAVFGFT
jgi:hypothetical protein